MRAAQPYIKARQTAQRQAMIRNRANGKACGIEGCKYHAHKGQLCRKHYAMIPQGDKLDDRVPRRSDEHGPRTPRSLPFRAQREALLELSEPKT